MSVKIAETNEAMDRLSPWNTLKQKFSPHAQPNSTKTRPKRKKTTPDRKTVPFSVQKTESARLNPTDTSIIEDSDDDNLQQNTQIDNSEQPTKSKKSKLVPLDTSVLYSLRQPVTEISATGGKDAIPAIGDECLRALHSNSLLKQCADCHKTSPSPIGVNQRPGASPTPQSVFDGCVVAKEQADLEASIVDTDTEDEDDASGKRSATAAELLDIQVDASQSDLCGLNSEPAIDSVSSFGSIQYKSQTQFAPVKTQKRLKVTKGGLTDIFQRSIRKSKSDHAFWLNERQLGLAAPGERVLIAKIEQSYGRILVHCEPTDGNGGDVKVFFLDPESKKLPFLAVGKIIEVEFNTHEYRLDPHTLCYPHISNILVL